MPEILEELFNSKTRAKILKLLFRNEEKAFRVKEVAERAKIDYFAVRREVEKLSKIKILKITNKLFGINPDFQFFAELKNLVVKSNPISKEKILKQLKNLGKIQLIILSGVFVNAENTRADMFVVGDGLSQKKVEKFFKDLESEVGKEIDYVLMETSEYKYRKQMFDKFILEILEGPKEVLWNKLGID